MRSLSCFILVSFYSTLVQSQFGFQIYDPRIEHNKDVGFRGPPSVLPRSKINPFISQEVSHSFLHQYNPTPFYQPKVNYESPLNHIHIPNPFYADNGQLRPSFEKNMAKLITNNNPESIPLVTTEQNLLEPYNINVKPPFSENEINNMPKENAKKEDNQNNPYYVNIEIENPSFIMEEPNINIEKESKSFIGEENEYNPYYTGEDRENEIVFAEKEVPYLINSDEAKYLPIKKNENANTPSHTNDEPENISIKEKQEILLNPHYENTEEANVFTNGVKENDSILEEEDILNNVSMRNNTIDEKENVFMVEKKDISDKPFKLNNENRNATIIDDKLIPDNPYYNNDAKENLTMAEKQEVPYNPYDTNDKEIDSIIEAKQIPDNSYHAYDEKENPDTVKEKEIFDNPYYTNNETENIQFDDEDKFSKPYNTHNVSPSLVSKEYNPNENKKKEVNQTNTYFKNEEEPYKLETNDHKSNAFNAEITHNENNEKIKASFVMEEEIIHEPHYVESEHVNSSFKEKTPILDSKYEKARPLSFKHIENSTHLIDRDNAHSNMTGKKENIEKKDDFHNAEESNDDTKDDEITTVAPTIILPELTPVPQTESESGFRLGLFHETCTTVDGKYGSCINIYNCQEYVALLRNAHANPAGVQILRKAHCGFEGSNPKVCCPFRAIPTAPPPPPGPETEAPAPSTEAPAPRLMIDLPEPPECGVSNASFSRVVGGIPAKLGDFPWMALLGYKGRSNPKPRWLCGGSLVTKKHVLTAAHCIHGREEELYLVRLGELDLAVEDEGATPIDVPIADKIKHEEYSAKAFSNDIGLLVLSRDVRFTSLIRPICLPAPAELRARSFDKYNPLIAGWGDTQFRGATATHLQVLQLPVVSNDFCASAYSAYKAQSIDEKVICAGYKRGGKDACQGDSGGPLMLPVWNPQTRLTFFYQIGVVSFGRKCAEAGFPGVYSRVTYFMPWLNEKITGSPGL